VSFSASPASTSRHNDLLGIQGGDVDNYYHVTKVEYDGTGSGVLVRQTSPALLGTPTAPTAAVGDNSTTLATTAFIKNQYTFLTITPVSDADYTVTSTHGLMIVYGSLTASRSVFLGPATGSGQIIQVNDATGLCSSLTTVTLVASGSDQIEFGSSKIINYPYGSITVEDAAIGKWVVSANPNPNLSTGMQVKPSFTDLGTGRCTIGSGTYALYANSSGVGKIKSYVIPGNTFSLTDGVTNYIVANYNSGSPVIQVITNLALINDTTIIRVFDIYRQGTILHVLEWDQLGDAQTSKIHMSIVNTQRQRPEPGGLGLGEAATRLITVGSGTVWTGAVPTVLASFNSSTNTLQFAYHVAGAWTFSNVTQYNNTQYDDGTHLQTTPGAKYVVNFVYRSVGTDTECFYVLGGQAYTLLQAQASQPPGSLPSVISSHCILVGRIIVQQGASTATQVDSAFATLFTPSASVDHNSLSNIQGGTSNEYYHLTSAEYTGTGTGNFVRASGPSIATPTFTTSATFPFLTSGRVPFSTTGGSITDSASFTFNSGTGALSATSFVGSGASLTGFTSSQITTALGFTPINKAGDTGIGNLSMSALTATTGTFSGTITQVASDARISIKGGGSVNGFLFEQDSLKNAYIWNYEATSISFGTNNTTKFQIASNGDASFINNSVYMGALSATTGTFSGPIKTGVYTVATLPTGSDGMRAFVSDATATTFASAVIGGGTNHVPVYYDGGAAAWKIG
jgi:hypothetical protein